MRSLVILLVLGGVGCSGANAEPEASEPSSAVPVADPTPEVAGDPEVTETPEASADTPTESPAPTGGDAVEGDLCTRARACCRAYVSAIPSARRPLEERGCTEMDAVLGEAGEAADDVCEAAIGGWRQSLQLTGLEVPADCQ